MEWKTGLFYPEVNGDTLWEECNKVTYQLLYFKSSSDIYPVLWWFCPAQTGSVLAPNTSPVCLTGQWVVKESASLEAAVLIRLSSEFTSSLPV